MAPYSGDTVLPSVCVCVCVHNQSLCGSVQWEHCVSVCVCVCACCLLCVCVCVYNNSMTPDIFRLVHEKMSSHFHALLGIEIISSMA